MDLFNKADVSKTGCISLKDYINICEDHGMHLDEEDLELITALVNDYGKVLGKNISQLLKVPFIINFK